MGGYLDVKVCVFQVQRTEPVPCANLREDLLQRDHPERPSHEGVIQASEIEDGPEAAILFGDEEVTAVKAWLTQSWRDHFYGSFFQQRHHLWAQNASVLALHRGGVHAAETRGSSSELEWITSFYCPHNPIWHSGDGLPGLGPRGKGLDKLEWLAARRQGTHEGRKRKIALFLRMFVFYFFHCHSRRLQGRLYGPCSNKHNSLCTRKRTGWKEVLVGGPAVAGLDPLLFLSYRSGGRRRRRVQRYLGSGALALRISPSRKRTRCDRHRRAGGTCTSRSNGAALERRFALLEPYVRFAGWRQRTGPELLRCWGAKKRRISQADRGRWVQLRGVSMASRLLGQCRRSRRCRRRRNLRILWRNGHLYSQMALPILAGSGGFRCHWLVQLRCRPIGSFFTTARTNSRAVSLRDWIRLQFRRKKGFFPYASLSRRSTSGVSTGNSICKKKKTNFLGP